MGDFRRRFLSVLFAPFAVPLGGSSGAERMYGVKMRYIGDDDVINGVRIVHGGVYRVVRGLSLRGYPGMPVIGVFLHDGRRDYLQKIPYGSEETLYDYWELAE